MSTSVRERISRILRDAELEAREAATPEELLALAGGSESDSSVVVLDLATLRELLRTREERPDTSGAAADRVGGRLYDTEWHLREHLEREVAERCRAERRFKTLVDIMPVGVYSTDRDGCLTFYNDRAAEMWGRRPDIDAGERYCGSLRLYRPDGTPLPHAETPVLRALAEGREFRNAEAIVERPDGSRIKVLQNVVPIRDEAGAISGALSATVDVTALKRAEQQLRESRDLLTGTQQIAGAGSFDLDLKTNHAVWSEGLQRLYGFPARGSEVRMEDWLEWVLPEDRDRAASPLNAWIPSEEGTIEFRICRRDTGEVRWIEARGKVLRDETGTPVRIIGFNIDTTERKRVEERLHRSIEELRESDARERARAAELQAVMEAVPIAVFIARNPDCRYLSGNRMTYDLLRMPYGSNLSKSAPHGEKPRAFRIMRNGHEIPPHELPVQSAALTGRPVRNCEFEVVFEDGSSRYLIGDAVPLFGENGRPRGAVGAFLDMTERRRNEERLRQTQKLESIGLLAGGIAHDFNNLLVGIMGNASLVLEDVGSAQQERIKDVIASAERAAHLTSQLLAYSGKGQFVVRDLDVSQAVNEMAGLVEFSIPKSVQLSVNVQRRLPSVRMDPSQLHQILMNLVINAGEAIGEGNPGRVAVATSMADISSSFVDATGEEIGPGRYVRIQVSDTGSGIDGEMKSKIFDPFFSTKFTGRGLGLAAVAGIVRSANGAITVDSSPGRGSSFSVFLPVVDRGAPEVEKEESATRGTVLVVDDEATVRDFIQAALSKESYRVLVASDGREALSVSDREPGGIDAVVLDVVMPVMGAKDLLPRLRERRADIRVLLTSGYSESEARRLCAAYPGAAFIQKPYTAGQLVKAIADLIAR